MSDPVLAEEVGRRFDHVLVDEYQDTNRLAGIDPAGAEAGRRGPYHVARSWTAEPQHFPLAYLHDRSER